MNKVILLIVLLFTTSTITAQKVNWVSFEEAIALQKEAPRKIIVDMYTVWCGPCKSMERNTFGNKDVVEYINTHYYAVKFNAQGNEKVTFKGRTFTNPNYKPELAKRRNGMHQLALYYKVQAFPTLVFIDENAEFLTPLRGYKTPQQLELYLKLFKENKHKEMTTQKAFDAYFKAFKPKFKTK
ncbi:MAG: thioredoxin family protein [Flavobacteriaceae bacterium]|nr:thioredoxin family protein [Flavobacteriaceae bacterium]